VQDELDELLEVGRSWSRRRRAAGWILVVLAVLALIAVRAWTGSRTPELAVPSTAPALPTGEASAGQSPTPWPRAPGACDGVALLPIVSSTPPAGRTDIKVLLGGDRLRLVDFDSGQVTAHPDAVVRPGEYAAVLAGDPVTAYATTRCCDETAPYGMLRISVDHQVSVIQSIGPNQSVLADRNRAWIVTYPTDADHPYGTITSVPGGPRVRLPVGFYPSAVVNDTIAEQLQPDPSAPPTWLVLVDTRTGRVRARLEQAALPLAAGANQLIWTSGCQQGEAKPCTLNRRSVASGAANGYPLPRAACCGVVSPDGTEVAFLLQRATTDPRFEGHPLPPSDIAVMHLDTGRLEVVPGIEMSAKSSPGLAFANGGNWLVMALDAGTRTRLLAWRSGLRQPYETTAIPGLVRGPPTLIIVAHSAN
jgi:hypothetical protein